MSAFATEVVLLPFHMVDGRMSKTERLRGLWMPSGDSNHTECFDL